MKTLVLIFHPHINNSRVNEALKQEVLKNSSKEVIVRDEYEKYPNEKIDVELEQRLLEKAGRIVLQFPMYWYSSPSLLKKWEDKVLLHGWAYGSSGNALKGKEMIIAVSTGASAKNYHIYGDFHYTIDEMLIPFKATSNLIGTKFLKPFILQGVMQNLTDEQLKKESERYVDYILSNK